ncbi:MAG: hypothetical protein L3J43_09950 [Sulfurovum sp.]|nr:hypothetical protein [Sulfurovum sp.]
MKTLYIHKPIQTLAAVSVVAFTLLGCGGESNWGIDGKGTQEVAHGPLQSDGKYRCDLGDASLVKSGGVVTPLTSDTQVRVWHFQNSEEYVCTLQGQASIEEPKVAGEKS